MSYYLVTGAYGGMGRATVAALKRAGHDVFALDRKVGAAEEHILPIEADVTDRASLGAAFGAVSRVTDELAGIIHFAGIYLLDSLIEMPPDDFSRAFGVNLFGAYLVNRTFFPLLRKGGRIVITTSELAPIDPLPFTGIYAVTKGALDRYAYALRMELQLRGISVSVLRAGAVNTGMLGVSTEALDAFCRRTRLYSCNAERFRKIVDGVEAKRVPPEKIARKVLSVLGSRSPRFAYGVNRNSLLRLFGILPARLQFRLIREVLK